MKGVEIFRPYIRNSGFPIDALSLFPSYKDALEYAHNNPSAYPTQIIGIDDKINKQSEIYKLNYDPNHIHRFILEKIDIGYGSSAFKFKGSIPTVVDLHNLDPESVVNGDMWLVEETDSFYVATVNYHNAVVWKEVSISVRKVTKENDGLMPKEVYESLFNTHETDALYFSKKELGVEPNPENNGWISVEHTTKENNLEYSIPSIGMVKELISSIIEQTNPHIKLTSETPLENKINTFIKPNINITYYKEFGGNPTYIKIFRNINNEGEQEVWNSAAKLRRNLNERKESYLLSFTDNEANLTASNNNCISYRVIVGYDDSVDSNLSAGECEEIIKFYFYNTISYGHNLKTFPEIFCKNENLIELNYNPNDYSEKINEIFIQIPKDALLEYVEYVPQHDLYAKSLFNETIIGDSKRYSYHLSGDLYFKNPGKYIFKIKQ